MIANSGSIEGPTMHRLSRLQHLESLLLGGLAALTCASGTAGAADSVPTLPGSDWEGYNNSLDGQRYSLLDQINTSNAANLVEVCRASIAARGSLQSGLVVVGDSIFVPTATETFAVDPVN